MSKYNTLEKAKAKLKVELEKEQPDKVLVTILRRQIMMLGIGLTGRDIKPF